jgi:hypothetical protein
MQPGPILLEPCAIKRHAKNFNLTWFVSVRASKRIVVDQPDSVTSQSSSGNCQSHFWFRVTPIKNAPLHDQHVAASLIFGHVQGVGVQNLLGQSGFGVDRSCN